MPRRKGIRILVLTRKLDEVICIGADIRIKVVSIRGDKIRLGIDAPTNVRIDREEVYLAIQAEKPPIALRADQDTP